jgi:hypothetical protein
MSANFGKLHSCPCRSPRLDRPTPLTSQQVSTRRTAQRKLPSSGNGTWMVWRDVPSRACPAPRVSGIDDDCTQRSHRRGDQPFSRRFAIGGCVKRRKNAIGGVLRCQLSVVDDRSGLELSTITWRLHNIGLPRIGERQWLRSMQSMPIMLCE